MSKLDFSNEDKIKRILAMEQDPKHYIVVRISIAEVKIGLLGKDETLGFVSLIPNNTKDALDLYESLYKETDRFSKIHDMTGVIK